MSEAAAAIQSTIDRGAHTVLVVDDNAVTRYSTARVIRAAGFVSTEAALPEADRYSYSFDGEFGKAQPFLTAIENGPFYIARIDALVVVVDGGIMTNVRSEVLDDASKPIPGLYAVGLDGAMLWRNVYTQNMPGTAMANNINSGRNAANAAAKYIA